jgi:hypothetical protein
VFYANAVSSILTGGDGVNLQTTTVQFKDMNSPTASSKFESLTEFITRRVSTNDRINIFNYDVCVQKNSSTYNLNFINNSGVGETRTTNIKSYMVYPANISISQLRDMSVPAGQLGEFVDMSAYLNVTGANTSLAGNTYTAGTPYESLSISGVPYRILQLPPSSGAALSATGSYKISTCT